jgi:hypothetical protein
MGGIGWEMTSSERERRVGEQGVLREGAEVLCIGGGEDKEKEKKSDFCFFLDF